MRVDVQSNGSYWTIKSYRAGSDSAKKTTEVRVSIQWLNQMFRFGNLQQTSVLHVDGYLSYEKVPIESSVIDLEAIRARCKLFSDAKSKYTSCPW